MAIHLKDGKNLITGALLPKAPPKLMRKENIVEEFDICDRKVYKIRKKNGNKRALIFLHGGAYEKGFATPHWVLIERLLKAMEIDVFAPDYPLVPHTHDEALEMVVELYKSIVDNYGSENIFVMGDSAGGGLALGFCMYLRDHGIAQPSKNIMISPWLDLSLSNPEIDRYDYFDPWLNRNSLKVTGRRYAGKEGPKGKYCSPIYNSPEGLCKMFITFGTYDILCPDGLKFKQLCDEHGVELAFDIKEKMLHTYPMLPVVEAAEAREKIIEFILETE